MAKRLILAVAGAGKTYYLCHNINPDNRNLILAFTNQNIENIKKELIDSFGEVPLKTNVMTFHSFVHRYCLMPYEPTIQRYFRSTDKMDKNITFIDPPVPTLTKNGRRFPNPRYHKNGDFKHYHIDSKYYCSTMAELILNTKDVNGKKLVNRISNNLTKFYDQILVDEFQDFRMKEYDLLIQLTKNFRDVVFVGDYYQHSVSGKNNSGKPFDNISYSEFIKVMEKLKFAVDNKCLLYSRRCSDEVCNFVTNKLGIKIESTKINQGNIILLDDIEMINEIIQNNAIVKMVYNNTAKYNFNAVN